MLGDELGQDGMGPVFRAEDTRLHRDVAVKLLSEELSKDPEMHARLEQEARALAQLSHPNIVQILGVVSCLVWIARRAAQHRGFVGPAIYAPFSGSLLELYSLNLFFLAMLHAWQTARPLRREPWLFVGFGRVLVPPASEFLRFVSTWKP